MFPEMQFHGLHPEGLKILSHLEEKAAEALLADSTVGNDSSLLGC